MKNISLSKMEAFFLALSDKTRLRLLSLMREDEVCVCFFTEVLGESQPKISRHLAYLRSAGVVTTRRDGKWINYRIAKLENEYAAQVLADTLEWLESQEEMQDEYQKLMDIYYHSLSPATNIQTSSNNILPKANMTVPRREEIDTFLL